MKIWLDADNGPHVLILRPVAAELQRRGHEVRFTARDRTGTCELLDLYGLPYVCVGREFGAGKWRKVRGTLGRAGALVRAMHRWRPDVAFGHGSRSLPLAARGLRRPSVTMFDYEWVDPRLFNLFCRTILVPDVIEPARCREAGIAVGKVRPYPGLKEHLYLDGRPLAPEPVAADLGLASDRVAVLLRPPATSAHYHNPEAEVILREILACLAGRADVQLIYLRRSADQMRLLEGIDTEQVIVPRRVYDGPSLVAAMDLIISGGGTMTREAAVLGVPSYTFFRGRPGRVDESLERQGRLVPLTSVAEVRPRLRVVKRHGALTVPDSAPLVAFVCDAIEAAATRPAPAPARAG